MSVARVWFAATALVVAVAVVIQVIVAADNDTGVFDSPAKRALNVFVFFTIQSNLIVGATSLLLALDPRRSSTAFAVARLTGVVAIAVTGIVYHTVLSGLDDLSGWALVANFLLHTLVPLLGVIGWVAFGPRGQTSWTAVGLTIVYMLAWGVFTLVRGEIVDFYPYPFTNPTEQGYARVALKLVFVGGGFVALAAAAHLADRYLTAQSGRSDDERRVAV